MLRRTFLSALPAAAVAAPDAAPITAAYRDSAARLIGAALTDAGGWRKLSYLCDRIGHRISGSPQLQQAVAWAAAEMRREGFDNVVTPPAKVSNWVRGRESAHIVAPLAAPIAMLGLGGSIATPPEGLTAEVICVRSFDELAALPAGAVAGKIVLYDVPYLGYGRTVQYRAAGASRAAQLGAVAALVRSAGLPGHRTPHTGAMNYAAGAPKIPAAAIALEDSTRIARLLASGETVRVTLKMEARSLPEADSANVVGEIRGREKPEEIVVLGGHLDSWDVGQGAQDDGAGCIATWQALTLIHQLQLRPRRTLRVVLWVDEEQGGGGALAYAQWATETVRNHVAAIEMDGGAERPAGFGLSIQGASAEVQSRALARLRQIGALLEGIGAGEIVAGGGGADIAPLMRQGVPGIGHRTSGGRYFEWHHTDADTLDTIDPREFRLNTAALAVLAYVLADMPERLAE